MVLAQMAICVVGFFALALTTPRSQQILFGQPLSQKMQHAFRILGWGCLASAFVLMLSREGFALGLVHYSGCTSVAAGLTYCGLIAKAASKSQSR